MQIKDMIKPLDEMSDDELMAQIREVRRNRMIVRPAAVARATRAEKKTSRTKVTKVAGLLDSLSQEEREALIKQLEGDNGG